MLLLAAIDLLLAPPLVLAVLIDITFVIKPAQTSIADWIPTLHAGQHRRRPLVVLAAQAITGPAARRRKQMSWHPSVLDKRKKYTARNSWKR